MKKTIIAITLLAGAVSGYSQGEITFEGYATGATTLRAQIFNTQANATTAITYAGQTVYEILGNTSVNTANPKGTTVYSGTGLTGSGYTAELLAGPSGATSYDQLTPISSSFLPFKPSAGLAGYTTGSASVTLPTSAAFGQGSTPVFAIAAWNNLGGTVTSLAAAVAGDVNNSDPWGISSIVQSTTALNVAPNPVYAAMPLAQFGFSLGVQTPEPSTIALGVMGASALLFRRRK
jgi:hypothetical protein